MLKQLLHNNWTVKPVGDLSVVRSHLRDVRVSANVPSTVHTALLRAGKIPDPYVDRNELDLQWIGQTDWQYRLEFDADENLFTHERIDLCFDGLDTVAFITLNDQSLPPAKTGTSHFSDTAPTTQNMHRRYRFDVRSMLKRGKNILTITFASAVKYIHAMREQLGPRPYVNGWGGPFNFIRKEACNFGWDWGPALVTCGIWKSVRLEGWSVARIGSVRPSFTVDENGMWLDCHVETEFASNDWLPQEPILQARLKTPDGERLNASDNDKLTGRDEFFNIHIEDPKLWWPVGHGEQPLYRLAVRLKSGDEVLDKVVRQIALRTIELDTSPDSIGRRFALKINAKEIFCKGFNWIPDDCFIDRAIDPHRVRQRIQQAIDAGANMLRVWGGGIYETDDFYNICDEMGVMVWQDFPFACAMYPEEEPFATEVAEEVRDNVARLAHHPSLVLWNGNNENLWAYRDWGWKEKVADKTWGKNFYLDLIPKILRELDPSRPYWAGSPWSGDYDVDNGVHPNAPTHGNRHVWDMKVMSDYRNTVPRFVSEFGAQGPATYSSIASIVPRDQLDFGSLSMRHRQKSGNPVRDDADRLNLRRCIDQFNLPGMAELLDALNPPDPTAPMPECGHAPLHAASKLPSTVNFDDLHYLFQLYQSRALTLGVEWFRSRMPTCMGTLYWQLNDCWPGSTSWSCIDASGNKKPLWYATRRFYAPRLFTIQPAEAGLELCAINDTDDPKSCNVRLTRQTFDGEILAQAQLEIAGAANSAMRAKIPDAIATPSNPAREMIVAHANPRAFWYFDSDKNLEYPAPAFVANLSAANGKQVLTVTAKSLLRDLCIFVDRLDPRAETDDQLLTILPGESAEIEINSQRQFTLEQLTTHPVMQCANRFGKK